MPAQDLRPYQANGLKQILDAWKQGARSVLAVAPTGSGKTTIFSHLIAQLNGGKHSSVVLVHRRELATQACNRLREFGVDFGLIMAGEQPKPYARVQVASVQTLIRRKVPSATLVVCDEAHLSAAESWKSILDQYPNARILGVTATPWRLGGKPLAGMYDASVVVATPAELREEGSLCDYVGFSYRTPDLSEVKTVGGEYNEQQTAAAMMQSVIVDTVVEEWIKHASHLSTVVFAVTVEHSQQLTAKFKAAGVSCEHLDGATPKAQRDAILQRVADGRTKVLCNVGVAVEGLDIPRLKCCVLARPTKSLARAIQMMGRVRRPWQGVTARVHDHAFNIRLHGLPDDDRDYSLSAKPDAPPSLSTCSKCMAMFHGRSCPACGSENESEPAGERVLNTIEDAEQFEFTSAENAVPSEVLRPPVEIRWTEPGRVVMGTLLETYEDQTQYGPITRYVLQGTKRRYMFAGTSRLNALMEKVPAGALTRVTYLEETKLGGGKVRKEFKVEVDEVEERRSL